MFFVSGKPSGEFIFKKLTLPAWKLGCNSAKWLPWVKGKNDVLKWEYRNNLVWVWSLKIQKDQDFSSPTDFNNRLEYYIQ